MLPPVFPQGEAQCCWRMRTCAIRVIPAGNRLGSGGSDKISRAVGILLREVLISLDDGLAESGESFPA
jgi:hypothetical protein